MSGLDLLVLLVPVLLGLLAGVTGIFPRVDEALDALNTFALRFAFPALVLIGIADARFVPPEGPGFWLVPAAALAMALAPVALVAGRVRPHGGTVALTTSFGNVAYLGLPVVDRVYGAGVLGIASLIVAVHVTMSLLVGPLLLLRWGERPTGAGVALGRVARQPLLWAPVVAFALRAGPEPIRAAAVAGLTPVGRAAGPTALFLLGLYLHAERRRVASFGAVDGLHVAWKLIVLPLATAGLLWAAGDAVEPEVGQVALLLATMPSAITTFALARELDVGQETVARAVVVSTIVALVALPWTIRLCRGLL